jgi:ABC-type transporter Mla subunit MlaD
MTTDPIGQGKGETLSGAEIGKDAVQSTIEAAATTVGEVATILTRAVRDVATAVGDFATEVFEIRDSSRKAAEDAGPADVPIPEVEDQVED